MTADAFREEVRSFLREHWTVERLARVGSSGTMHDWELHRALAERRWLLPTWRQDEGGLGWEPMRRAVFFEEATRAGAPLDGLTTTTYVAETLRLVGTAEQQRTYIDPILRGEAIAALGFTEADAGSDVAAARTRARRDGDEWVIDGEKMFTTLAHEARWVFLLTRTDNSAGAKHRGLTMFLVPLGAEGVDIRAIPTFGGERTNVTAYCGVRVPDQSRVGAVNDGWHVLSLALGFEHGLSFSGECLRLVDHVASQMSGAQDRAVRDRVGRAVVDAEVARLLAYRSAVAPEVAFAGPMAKLFSTEALVHHASALLDVIGSDALRGDGEIERTFRHSVVTTIYGGSSEIQRSLIARELGLDAAVGA